MFHSFVRFCHAWLLVFALWPTSDLRAQEADPNDDQARALFEAGVAASRQARWSDAEELFERSQLLVEKPSTLLNLAIAQVNLGHGGAALGSLSRLASIADPIIHAAVLERARSLREEAHALALASAHRELLLPALLEGEALTELNAGASAYAEGRYADALASFERAESLSRRSELLFNVGLSADRLGDHSHALLAFEAFVAELPDHPRARALGSRLSALRRIVRGEAEPADPPNISPGMTISVRPRAALAPTGPRVAPLRSLRLPRTLMSLAPLVALGSWPSAQWWIQRMDAQERCDRRRDLCSNRGRITRQRRAALATTVLLDALALGLLVGGATLLVKRKQDRARMQSWLRISPNGLTFGIDNL